MANNRAYDTLDSYKLNWPYSPNSGKLSEDDVLVQGTNFYISWARTLKKRLGTSVLGTSTNITACPERLWFYQTVESSPVTYVVGSFKNGSVYELRYQRIDTPTVWVLASEVRGSNHSQAPHEGCIRRGKLYIKGTPSASDDPSKLGSIILNGTSGSMTTAIWGSLGPTSPAALTPPIGIAISAATNANPVQLTTASPHGFSTGKVLTFHSFTGSWVPLNGTFSITVTGASTFTVPVNSTAFGALTGSPSIGWETSLHSVTVNYSWLYVYTWVEASGQETNRSPLETNPDKPPSATGPFTNLRPTMRFVGPTDTVTYPYLNVYRTTDGGGTFFFLKQITNTGGNITFVDTFLESGVGGGVFSDPLPDANLDTSKECTTANSNSPPPTVTPPQVTGTDTIKPCTKIVEYSARLWYAIDEYVFFSANEELRQGIPEESFPSGIREGNFFRFNSKVVYLEPTNDGLIVVTKTGTARIPGTSKAAFNTTDFLNGTPGIGGLPEQPLASCAVGPGLAWISQDYRLIIVKGDDYTPVTGPVGDAIAQMAAGSNKLQLLYWSQGDLEWLIVLSHDYTNASTSKWLIYDLHLSREVKIDFWQPPWTIKTVVAAVGQIDNVNTNNTLCVGLWNGTNFQLCRLDDTVASDPTPGNVSTLVGYACDFTSSLHGVPLGDHVNQRREPFLSSVIDAITLDRTRFSGDSTADDPIGSIFIDDYQTTPLDLGTPVENPTRTASKGYKSLVYTGLEVSRVCRHVAVKFSFSASTRLVEVLRLGFVWEPDSGI